MIAVTGRAKKALLAKRLDAGVVDVDVGLRLTSATDGTLLLVVDRARAGDHVVVYEDAIVLLVDGATAAVVSPGRMLDCRRSDGSVEIVLASREPGDGAADRSDEDRSEEPRSA
jgi:hypothetical protein